MAHLFTTAIHNILFNAGSIFKTGLILKCKWNKMKYETILRNSS